MFSIYDHCIFARSFVPHSANAIYNCWHHVNYAHFEGLKLNLTFLNPTSPVKRGLLFVSRRLHFESSRINCNRWSGAHFSKTWIHNSREESRFASQILGFEKCTFMIPISHFSNHNPVNRQKGRQWLAAAVGQQCTRITQRPWSEILISHFTFSKCEPWIEREPWIFFLEKCAPDQSSNPVCGFRSSLWDKQYRA